jgi:tetrapyrrole methylase family protein/MazG family protein
MNKIKVLGLGAGDLNQLPFGIYKELQKTDNLYLRTKDHPVISELETEGLTFQSFDEIYEKHDRFEEVYQEIVQLLVKASEEGSITYAVPGHPLVAEKTVQLLIELADKGNIQLDIKGGQSFLDAMFTSLKIDPIEGFQFVDATDLEAESIKFRQHLIISQV